MTTSVSKTGPLTGSCLCAKVQLTIDSLSRDVVYCHCSQCRKQSGHFFAATSARDEQLHIEGSEHLVWYSASDSAKRGFCQNCGSILMWKADGSNTTSILAGCLNDTKGLKAISHIYVSDKGDYYDIADGLPEFAQSD